MRIIWDSNPGKYHPVYNEDLVKSIQFRMQNHSYRFRPMIRIILPKPKGPGKLGPITLPAHDDILVLDAMARLLLEELEPPSRVKRISGNEASNGLLS